MLKHAFAIVFLATALGALRQTGPRGLQWTGKWPTSNTSSEEAYRMMAREGDPGYVGLNEMMEIQEKKSAVILDARTPEEFSAGRIPGSRNLPYYQIDQFKESALAELNTDSPIVIYCEGIGCELSFFLGRDLMAGGFTQVRIFYGGYPEWTTAGLAIESGT